MLLLQVLMMSAGVTGAVVSLYDVGCFIGAMSLGYLADPYGRERTLAFASVIVIIGAMIQAASYSITQIVGAVHFQFEKTLTTTDNWTSHTRLWGGNLRRWCSAVRV